MKQVCYGIVGKTRMYMSECCICEDADALAEELEIARKDYPNEDFQIVPLYTRRRLTSVAGDGATCDTCGETNIKGNVCPNCGARRAPPRA